MENNEYKKLCVLCALMLSADSAARINERGAEMINGLLEQTINKARIKKGEFVIIESISAKGIVRVYWGGVFANLKFNQFQ